MSVTQFLTNLAARGVSVRLADGALDVEGPDDVLTDALLSEIVGAKPAIMALLTVGTPRCATHIDASQWSDTRAEGRPGWLRTTCRHCAGFIGYRPVEPAR